MTTALVLFGDLVCPFCYALDERLDALGVEVAWQGVQHAPELPVPMRAAAGEQRAALNAEVGQVRRLAPEVPIEVPPGLPNSLLATATVAAVAREHPTVGRLARQSLARAVWRDGRDISDPTTVAAVLREAGVTAVEVDDHARETAASWQRAWERAGVGVVPTLMRGPQTVAHGLVAQDDLVHLLGIAAT